MGEGVDFRSPNGRIISPHGVYGSGDVGVYSTRSELEGRRHTGRENVLYHILLNSKNMRILIGYPYGDSKISCVISISYNTKKWLIIMQSGSIY